MTTSQGILIHVLGMNPGIRSDVINNTANVMATFNNPSTSVDFKPISMTLSFRMLQLDFVFGDTQFPLFSPDFL